MSARWDRERARGILRGARRGAEVAEEPSGASIARARAGAGPAPAGSPPSCGKLRNSSLNPSSRAAASHARAADSLSL